ncbi:exodeoxyribonuclease I [Candidatus Electronema sp. PJ]|uniref:exodeoxyribonuclease I n=1 Tax=Candidatus Electronema sp. PJ TaxID=3401572 RepID=UPI003AA7C8E4
MTEITLLWHDYETWGLNPRKDRPAQFAAVRTNLELEEISEPLVLWCCLAGDALPHPEAVLLTGISPQEAAAKGLNEAAFFRQIHAELSLPGTCGVGYNSLRFDDEVTRFGFYRNFIDPYAREWQDGCARWDIIDLVRVTHALRPEQINWEGSTSFRLDLLAAANGINHEAHDALSDVRATLALARLLKQLKPRLYDYCFQLRQKNEAAKLLNLQAHEIVLHVSGMYPAAKGCIAPVIPLLQHPRNKNEIIVYDLRQDPQLLLAMTPEEMAENLYARSEEMPEGFQRLALKGVHCNKSPVLAPVNTLTPAMAEKWQIDWPQIKQHRQQLLADKTLTQRLTALYQQKAPASQPPDADAALYEKFISDKDRRLCNEVLAKKPEQLAAWEPPFADERLRTLYFRYRARNWPEYLEAKEQEQWRHFCEARLLEGQFGNELTLARYRQILEELASNGTAEQQPELFKLLVEWVH